jgi:hypothetical protein
MDSLTVVLAPLLKITVVVALALQEAASFYICGGSRPDRLAGGVGALNTLSRAFSTQTANGLSSALIKL